MKPNITERMKVDINKLSKKSISKIPVVLVLDTSDSMNHNNAINELNQGVENLVDSLSEGDTKHSVELAIVTFSDTAKVHLDFTPISDEPYISKMIGDGLTSMGAGGELGFNLAVDRKIYYQDTSQQYYQPMMFLLTDGMATDDTSKAAKLTRDAEANRKLSFFPIGCGSSVDVNELKKFTAKDITIGVQSPEYFKDMFEWISQSIKGVSQSKPGDKIKTKPLPSEGFDVYS